MNDADGAAHWITTSTDEALARRSAAGSVACFAELVARYEGPIHNFLLRRTAISADAEDLTQQTFIRAWLKIDRFDPNRPFRPWLYTIAARLAVAHHRRRERERLALRWLAAGRDGEHAGEDPLARTARHEQTRDAWTVAERVLSPEQRAILWLRYAEAMPIADVARIMGRTAVSVRVTLFRARRALRRHLEPAAIPRVGSAPDAALIEPIAGGAH